LGSGILFIKIKVLVLVPVFNILMFPVLLGSVLVPGGWNSHIGIAQIFM